MNGIRFTNSLTPRLKRLSKEFPNEVGAALYQESQIELTESKKRVPVDTGTLRASGVVTEPDKDSSGGISVSIAYGGAAEDYALVVHEDLEAFHRVGEAKYLENVLMESAPHMAQRLSRRLQLSDRNTR